MGPSLKHRKITALLFYSCQRRQPLHSNVEHKSPRLIYKFFNKIIEKWRSKYWIFTVWLLTTLIDVWFDELYTRVWSWLSNSILWQAFDDAIAELDTLNEDSYKDSTLIMQVQRLEMEISSRIVQIIHNYCIPKTLIT